MTEYVSKNEVRPYRRIFDKMMADIRESVRKKGITFTYTPTLKTTLKKLFSGI